MTKVLKKPDLDVLNTRGINTTYFSSFSTRLSDIPVESPAAVLKQAEARYLGTFMHHRGWLQPAIHCLLFLAL